LAVPLGLPTEREAAHDLAGIRGWITAWHGWQGPGELAWTERAWPSLGRQRLPERLLLHSAQQVADWIGEGARWRLAVARRRALCNQFPVLAPHLGRHFDWLANAPGREFERLSAVLAWLAGHPDSGLYVRQLPIAGVDSKWIAANRSRVTELLRLLLGGEGDLHALAGLRPEPVLLRMRLLDPELRAAVGGLGDITAPVEEISALSPRASRIFIVENLQTGLAFGDLAGSLVFLGRGYAVDVFGDIPWLMGRPCYYWGDLDTHGLVILDRLRFYLPQTRSLLMDQATLLAHRDLWGQESQPATTRDLPRLTAAEQELYQGLIDHRWAPKLRLEQERIGWHYAWRQLESLLAGPRRDP
jgi:hypothetical protein